MASYTVRDLITGEVTTIEAASKAAVVTAWYAHLNQTTPITRKALATRLEIVKVKVPPTEKVPKIRCVVCHQTWTRAEYVPHVRHQHPLETGTSA